jgi:hypothetical protein
VEETNHATGPKSRNNVRTTAQVPPTLQGYSTDFIDILYTSVTAGINNFFDSSPLFVPAVFTILSIDNAVPVNQLRQNRSKSRSSSGFDSVNNVLKRPLRRRCLGYTLEVSVCGKDLGKWSLFVDAAEC